MAPNKTIYIKDADKEIWERAEKLSGGSVSSLIAKALRRYVEETELRERTDLETIEIELGDEERRYRAAFVGRWLVAPDPDETRTSEEGSHVGLYDAGAYYGVALTRRGKIAVYVAHVSDGFEPQLDTYDSFDEAEDDGAPGDILAMAAAVAGSAEYVRKLDI